MVLDSLSDVITDKQIIELKSRINN